MITYIIGDATRPIGDGNKIIAHICNDVGAWGKGFVNAISHQWKRPESEYRRWFFDSGLDRLPLGDVQMVRVSDEIQIANMIGQYGIILHKGLPPPIRYDALEACLQVVSGYARTSHSTVHMPRIGCGLAGGTWDMVLPIVDRTLHDTDVFVYDLPV